HDPATGRLRRSDPDVAADIAGGAPPRTVVGQLVRGLQARRAADAGPITLLSCDNLPSNGAVLRGLVLDFCAALADGDALAAWIAESVSFPSSMVDRIVPATTDADRAEAARLLGFTDHGTVVTEPFRQWVVEDRFAAGRPAWERAGVVLTADVAPYEAMKLRLLNGSHSTLAYLGALAGYAHVADAMADPGIAGVVAHLMADDVEPTLTVPDGFDVAAYQAELIERFHNPALRHRTVQIAMDGTQKLPQRLLGTIADRLAAGAEPRYACLGVAAWMRYVWTAQAEDGSPLPVADPLADRLRRLTAGAATAREAVDALLTLEEEFGAELPGNGTFRELVTDSLEALTKGGVAAATRIWPATERRRRRPRAPAATWSNAVRADRVPPNSSCPTPRSSGAIARGEGAAMTRSRAQRRAPLLHKVHVRTRRAARARPTPPAGPPADGVGLTRRLAVARLTPPQAVARGADLVAAVEARPVAAPPRLAAVRGGRDGAVRLLDGPPGHGSHLAQVGALRDRLAAATAGPVPAPGRAAPQARSPDGRLAIVAAVLREADAPGGRRARAELGRAVAVIVGAPAPAPSAAPRSAAPRRRPPRRPRRTPARAVAARSWKWALSVMVLVVVV